MRTYRLRAWSGRQDSNLRHPAPKAGALPGCATPRRAEEVYLIILGRVVQICAAQFTEHSLRTPQGNRRPGLPSRKAGPRKSLRDKCESYSFVSDSSSIAPLKSPLMRIDVEMIGMTAGMTMNMKVMDIDIAVLT